MRQLLSFLGALELVGIILSLPNNVGAFATRLPQKRVVASQSIGGRPSTSALGSGDLFEGFKRFWGGADDANNNEEDQSSSSGLTENEDDAAGSFLIASIPVRSIKPGGLRLFLMFHCMGMQNTPDRKSWRANQPTSEDYVVEMFFHDASGVLTIELLEDEVRITRCGSLPSTAYLMQESVVVQGVLDELHELAFEENIAKEHRLLIPEPLEAIDVARESLAFG